MIGQVVPAGRGFGGLVRYLLEGDRDKPNPNRVAWVAMRNILLDDPKLVPKLMRATAAKSKRVQKPVYHFAISWHPDEAPSAEVMRLVADTTCDDLGLADHQILMVAHHDTKHRHVHIVVNRVNPETGTAWHASKDYARIETSLKRQAEAMGMPFVPGPHSMPEAFKPASRRAKSADQRRAVREGDPLPTAVWSEERLAASRDRLREILLVSSSWLQLHRALAADGLTLDRKGQGLVISATDAVLKLSLLGKDMRLALLEERLGAFSPRPDDVEPRRCAVAPAPQVAEAASSVFNRQDRKPAGPVGSHPQTRVPPFDPDLIAIAGLVIADATSWVSLAVELDTLGLRLIQRGASPALTDGMRIMSLRTAAPLQSRAIIEQRLGQTWQSFAALRPDLVLKDPKHPPREPQSPAETQAPSVQAKLSPLPVASLPAPVVEARRRAVAWRDEQHQAGSSAPRSFMQAVIELLSPERTPAVTPSRPLFSERDLLFAFHGLGLLSRTELRKSLDRLAAEREQQRGLLDYSLTSRPRKGR